MEDLKQLAEVFLSKNCGHILGECEKLNIGQVEVEVESIWHNADERKYYVHCDCPEFEGDIDIESLNEENSRKLRTFLRKRNEDKIAELLRLTPLQRKLIGEFNDLVALMRESHIILIYDTTEFVCGAINGTKIDTLLYEPEGDSSVDIEDKVDWNIIDPIEFPYSSGNGDIYAQFNK